MSNPHIIPLDGEAGASILLDFGFDVLSVEVPIATVEYPVEEESLLYTTFAAAPLLNGRWVVVEATATDEAYVVNQFANVADEDDAHRVLTIWAETSVLAARERARGRVRVS